MEIIVKKYQQRFRKVKEEMVNWNELQSRLLSQFTNASSIIQRLQILQDSRNYGALRCVEGIQESVLLKQVNSLQTILISMNETLEKFHSVVLSLDKMVRDGRQLIKGGSVQKNVKQLQQRVGIKPSIADCLDGLQLLYEMHKSEYRLKLSVISAISAVALKPSATDDLGAFQQLLVDQPNIPKEEDGLMSTSMDPWTDEVLLEHGMCFKFRKTSVLTNEQEISLHLVLRCSHSSSVCVGSSEIIVFLEDPILVWQHIWRI